VGKFYRILSILFMPIVVLGFGGIWKLKSALQSKKRPNNFLLGSYDHFFSKHGAWIGYNSEFSSAPCFPHGYSGVFISGGARIGNNVVIFQQVTIGSNALFDESKDVGSPTIGDNVYIGAGAKIIGNIKIGNNCRIGANAVVYKDLPPHSVAVQSPTRVIQKANLDNKYYSARNGEIVYFNKGAWIKKA
jgi:serine O-acetyltransferase